MRRLRSLTACLLLALWLPATLHCALEQAGLLRADTACIDQCLSDNCDQLENGLYNKFASVALKAPTFAPLLCLCCLNEITPETIIVPLLSPERTSCPPELPRSWQFVSRAAPLPGAPSLAS